MSTLSIRNVSMCKLSLMCAMALAFASGGDRICIAQEAQAQLVRPETPPLYMHYMPWFETPATTGGNGWGIHWQMSNCDPEIVDEQGRRQIASHYYPQIGPYASSDPDVIEYHLLLMKLSGVSGILIDWYGVAGRNGDIDSLLRNSNAIVEATARFDMKFGVVLEDQFARSIDDIATNVNWLTENYFSRPNYIRDGDGDRPLLLVFGPQFAQTPQQWEQILGAVPSVALMPLWGESGDAGTYASGEFAWVWEDGEKNDHVDHVIRFLDRAPQQGVLRGGSIYPGFSDYYEEGGGEGLAFDIPHDGGMTLQTVINIYDEQRLSRCDFIQAVTWNDFGEGTMFEPTLETGYSYLMQLQQFTGTPFDESDLELAHQLYLARKRYAGNTEVQKQLDEVSALISTGKTADAEEFLRQLP